MSSAELEDNSNSISRGAIFDVIGQDFQEAPGSLTFDVIFILMPGN